MHSNFANSGHLAIANGNEKEVADLSSLRYWPVVSSIGIYSISK